MKTKTLVVAAAALGLDAYERFGDRRLWGSLSPQGVRTVFPALTCPAQATVRTAAPPSVHGVVANGHFDRPLARAFFWEQSSSLVHGGRIWDGLRRRGGKVGIVCWQQSLGLDADMFLSPGPVHKHHGGLVEAFHDRPDGLYDRMCRAVGRRFSLASYWGPLASARSSRWIAAATAEAMRNPGPDLLLTYLPHLDYAFQVSGPEGGAAAKAFKELESCLGLLLGAARANGYETFVFGDYAIEPATGVAFPNRRLLEAGLLDARRVSGRLYIRAATSQAFAMADHQVAHVYTQGKEAADAARRALAGMEGLDSMEPPSGPMASPLAGDLVLTAKPGWWFAYPWWTEARHAPDFATHIDIHNKPGYDPCELLMGWWPPFSVSQDATAIKGTHGRDDGPSRAALVASTAGFHQPARSLEEAARALAAWLDAARP